MCFDYITIARPHIRDERRLQPSIVRGAGESFRSIGEIAAGIVARAEAARASAVPATERPLLTSVGRRGDRGV